MNITWTREEYDDPYQKRRRCLYRVKRDKITRNYNMRANSKADAAMRCVLNFIAPQSDSSKSDEVAQPAPYPWGVMPDGKPVDLTGGMVTHDTIADLCGQVIEDEGGRKVRTRWPQRPAWNSCLDPRYILRPVHPGPDDVGKRVRVVCSKHIKAAVSGEQGETIGAEFTITSVEPDCVWGGDGYVHHPADLMLLADPVCPHCGKPLEVQDA